ncbi:PQQ-binding-like beta-propeller repeat protein [Streptomyces actuosus]|uniref:PQQ-binding-like beta-propeller repeat protein n=1 Tax=Streptomyces actuosus TaxID=1885 RepID=A0ABS2VSK2_STRAS|nr:PQQ-binding-like beta-propeller repeat protein [Streptomyces actuosus]MBN0046061.1 PQQ-binding-like beta-propeller repeat protein [Streptomyces actuosus]
MTQPPGEPPQPQEGFGAPQHQPPQPGGVFGAPQPPQSPPAQPPSPQSTPPGAAQTPPPPPGPPAGPQQPGYGYPQQPGPYAPPAGPYGTPPAPGPYTAPGRQPGPYGQQPGYGYGYPQQPQFPGAPGAAPGTGSRNPFRGKPALTVAAAVAALVVIGGTVYAVAGRGDEGPKNDRPVARQSDDHKASEAPVDPGDGRGDGGDDPEDLNAGRGPGESKVLWYKTAPDVPRSGVDSPGLWITGKAVVKAAYKEVVAYDAGDGRPVWNPVTFPQKICAVTRDKTSDDKVVVAYMSGSSDRAKCNQLQQIDLATGRKGWSGKVDDGALFDSALTVSLTLVGDTLMVGRSQSGTAFDVHSGKKLYEKKKYGSACFPTAFAGGQGRLVSVASCDAMRDTEHEELQQLDPRTGKVLWTRKLDKGWTVKRAYSLDPLVVYSENEDKNQWNISTFASGGTFRSQVGVNERFAPVCSWAVLSRDLQGCLGAVADADTLYLPTDATTGPNEIVAIGLADGKEKWRVKSPADASMIPLRTEGGKLVAYVEASYDAGGQVVSIPTAGSTHTPAKLLQNPVGTARVEGGFYRWTADWVGGRFYIASTRLTGNDDAKEKLMIAFGK